jgi:thiamine biosynthesis lipoprotein
VAWSLALEDSFDDDARRDYVRIAEGAIVTSSQRIRRFDTPSGTRHHLIDPSSHDSAATTVQTVTVIASTGARAETLSKSGFLRDTIAYLEWLPTVGAAGLVIDDNGVAMASGNWETYR